MKRLLRLRHWQIFMAIVGLPVILPVIIAILSGFIVLPYSETAFNVIIIVGSLLGILFCLEMYVLWFYAIGTVLYSYLPSAIQSNLKLKRFKIFMRIAIVYQFILVVYLVFHTFDTYYSYYDWCLTMVLFCLHLLTMLCILYCMYVAAKTLKAAELKRTVTFRDFAGEFFLLWFFPVGVWILQPRINKIIALQPESDMDIFKEYH